jgi:ferredoxin
VGVKSNADMCCYCGGCVGSCPAMAIELRETRIAVDNSRCVDCGNCIRVCPAGAMERAGGE